MKHRLLNFSAMVSALVLAVLAYGFVGRFGPELQRNAAVGTHTHYQELSFTLEWGRAKGWFQTWSPATVGRPAGTRIRWVGTIWPPRTPSMRRSIWEFDAHPLPIGTGSQAFIVACLIWCLAVPFLIAPSIWIWNRRRKENVGFPVIEPAA